MPKLIVLAFLLIKNKKNVKTDSSGIFTSKNAKKMPKLIVLAFLLYPIGIFIKLVINKTKKEKTLVRSFKQKSDELERIYSNKKNPIIRRIKLNKNGKNISPEFTQALMIFPAIISKVKESAKQALNAVIVHANIKEKKSFIIRFDCSWFYFHNAGQASEEFIYLDNHKSRVVVTFHIVEKSHITTRKGKDRAPDKKHSFNLKEIILLVAKQVFGYNQLRKEQLKSIEVYLSGKNTLVSIKTGGGKTFCYILCALIFNGITIIISPLKTLMEDQKWELIHLGLLKKNWLMTPIMLLTAICTYQDAQNIHASLEIPSENFITIWDSSFECKEMVIEVYKSRDNWKIFSADLVNLIKNYERGRIIIYYATQLGCNDLFAILQPLLLNKYLSIYHGGLEDEQCEIVMSY
ncbi:hypothetical protein C1646_764739 [Rhizophagus diaphanus]|nr:hypothetical protein C1646_764739 [Rhizophagus diaphanus] [Rhizophagus sp. MUCL 43196]